MKLLAVIPTAGKRPTREIREALEHQTRKPDLIAELRSKDVPTTVSDMLRVAHEFELVAIADDDAIPPANWLEVAEAHLQNKEVGYVCGALTAENLTAEQTVAQRRIAHVQASFFGSFIMNKRYKAEGPVSEVDETRIHGMGVYRREAYEKALATLGNIPLPGWEDSIATWLRKNGYKVIFDPALSSEHPARPSLGAFAKQIFKAGSGRANYFRHYKRDVVLKPWFLFPSVFLLSLFWWPWDLFIALVYTLLAFGSSEEAAGVPYYFANHISYGAGFLYGLVTGRTT